MKYGIVMFCLLATLPASHLHAESLYVPTIHAIQTDGDYISAPLAGTENGVSRTECEMRAEAWRERYAGTIQAAQNTLRDRGEHGSIRITCERK
jgi:hypothetical protein